jgi:hypothetical protein
LGRCMRSSPPGSWNAARSCACFSPHVRHKHG